MTRKPPSLAVLMLGCLAFEIVGVGGAAAQFGFFRSDKPLQYRKAYQLRPRYRPHPIALPPMSAEIPLPPPRPHFPDDAPEAPAQAEQLPGRTSPGKPAEMRKVGPPTVELGPAPSEGKSPATNTKPAIPKTTGAEPKTLVKPELPSRPAPASSPPATSPKRTTTPAMTVGPSPEELPAKGQTPKGQPLSPPPPPSSPTSSEPSTAQPITSVPPLPPEKPAELKPQTGVAPSGARLGEAPRQPDDDSACLDKLKARNVSIEPTTIGPQKDDRCTVVRPVHLMELTLPDGGKVEFPEHPTIACTTADVFSHYVRDLLVPLAKGTLGSPVTTVWTGPGLECRSRDSIFGAKLSAHGQGLAIDIAQLKLADGRKIEVGEAKDDAGQAFESAARAAACGYFHTVLGPGSDSYHRTHWHFDLIVRGAQGDSKYCK